MARRGEDFNFGGKLFLCIVVAVVCGFVWAMVETHRGPGDILKLFRGSETVIAETPKEPPKPEPAKPDPKKDPTPKPDPPKPDPGPRPPDPYSDAAMQSLFVDVDSKLRAGKIKEARDKIATFNKLLVPAAQAARFRELETRVDSYYRLLLETNPGVAVPMPAMAELRTVSGGHAIIVKNLVETGDEYAYETLTGIRSRLPKSQVQELTRITERGRQAAAVDYELGKMCSYRGVTIDKSQLAWVFLAGPKVNGLAFFDLADFCARNGHVARLVPLFEEALKRDPAILQTVHEEKGDRMVNVFFYLMSLHAKEDARMAYGILKSRYRDTRAYREKVEADKDVVDAYQVLVGEKIIAALPPPKPEDPRPPAPDPEPPRPDPPPVEASDPKVDPATGTVLPPGAPAAVERLVKEGDAAYAEAMKHLRNSDPNVNPDGWAAENKRALEIFGKAFEAYEKAQEEYLRAKIDIPKSLLKRIRETQMSRSLCRKRAVSSR